MRETDASKNASKHASQAMPTKTNTNPGAPGQAAGRKKSMENIDERYKEIRKDITKVLDVGDAGCGGSQAWQTIAGMLRSTLSEVGELQGLTREEGGSTGEKATMKEMIRNTIAEELGKALAPVKFPTGSGILPQTQATTGGKK